MKKYTICFIFLFSFIGFSQISKNIKPLRSYTKLSSYKELYGSNFTKEDSLNFVFHENDTLIPFPEEYYNKVRVSVPYEPKDSTFLELYKDVVYQKNSLSKKKKKYMRIWKIPIKIYFAKSLDGYYKKVIKETATKLSKEIDSLNITFVNNLENSNYVIYQIDDKHKYKYTKRISKNEYIDYYLFWEKNKIYDAKLELNLTKYNKISKEINANYLVQNFFKSLGCFSPTSKLECKSILSKCNSNKKEITNQDLEILKYHYSYGICKGIDLDTFEENHKNAKETFKKTGRHLHFMHQY